MLAGRDWIVIKNEYINGNISYRKLAEKYNVSFNTLQDRAKKEQWFEKKKKQHDKIDAKIRHEIESIAVQNEVNRIEGLLKLSDVARKKLELAFSQVDEYMTASGDVVKGKHVDVGRLKKLISSVKDLKDVIREDKSTDNTDTLQKLVEGFIEI